MNLKEIKERINKIKIFGDTPAYDCVIRNGYLVVCQNDGQLTHDPKKSGQDGYATFIGKFTPDEAIRYFNLEDE